MSLADQGLGSEIERNAHTFVARITSQDDKLRYGWHDCSGDGGQLSLLHWWCVLYGFLRTDGVWSLATIH